VREFESRSVQGLALHAKRGPTAVDGIGNERMAARGQMHADLVSPPAVQHTTQRTRRFGIYYRLSFID